MVDFHRWPSERREIRDPITGTPIQQLTAYPANHLHLFAACSSLTPGGEHLLFTSDRAGGAGRNLFRLSMATGVIEQVSNGDRWRPGGITPVANGRQAIAVAQGEDGEVVAIDLETGEGETLAVFPRAELDGCHLSASGEYVVTVVRREDERAITAVHTEGMRTVPILEDQRGIAAPRFSPDSKNSVLYVVTETLATRCVEFDGTGDRELDAGRRGQTTGHRGQADQPEGTPDAGLNGFCPPSWLGSGDHVLIVAGLGHGPIMGVPRQGGSARLIVPYRCAWARSDRAGSQIVALAASEGETGRGGEGGMGRGSAADGTSSYDLVLIDPLGGAVRRLCSQCSPWARPCFGPDSRSVVYADRDEHGYVQLFLVSVDEAAP